MHKISSYYFLLLLLILSGCSSAAKENVIPYSLKGTDLYIVGEYQGEELEGTLERGVMVGVGDIKIFSKNKISFPICEGSIKVVPSEKARVRDILNCDNKQTFAFSIRMTGPDQGVGIGRLVEKDGYAMFFFHPSKQEAKFRFPEVKEMLTKAINSD